MVSITIPIWNIFLNIDNLLVWDLTVLIKNNIWYRSCFSSNFWHEKTPVNCFTTNKEFATTYSAMYIKSMRYVLIRFEIKIKYFPESSTFPNWACIYWLFTGDLSASQCIKRICPLCVCGIYLSNWDTYSNWSFQSLQKVSTFWTSTGPWGYLKFLTQFLKMKIRGS